MAQFGLLGFPLSHSYSPAIHNEIAKIAKINFTYDLFSFDDIVFNDNLQKLKQLNGFNITIPYKTKIIEFLDKVSSEALYYGAVNTIKKENDCWIGFNTDVTGFLKSIALLKAPLNKKVLLLGAGGAARVMAKESLKQGADLTIAVRDTNSTNAVLLAKELLEQFSRKVNFCTFTEISGQFDTLLNATPAGMYPHVESCPVSDSVIENCDFIFDSIYNPKETKLLQKANALQKQSLGGMAMLVWQAVQAQKIWNNIDLTDQQVQTIIKKMQENL